MAIVVVLTALFWVLSVIGHALGLTPTFSEVTDKPDGWVSRHYRGAFLGYLLTVLIIVLAGILLWLFARTQSENEAQAASAREWLRRTASIAAAVLLVALLVPIGKRRGVDTDPGQAGSAGEGNVPDVVGKDVAEAKGVIEDAGLTASVPDVPIDDEQCEVVSQKPRAGGEVEDYDEVRLDCEVRVPRMVGRRADNAELRLTDEGFAPRFSNEPSD